MFHFTRFILLILFSYLLLPFLANAKMVVTDNGTQAASNAVQCGAAKGTVTVSTGAKWQITQLVKYVNQEGVALRTETKILRKDDDGVYIRYTGADAANFKWIQFVRIIYRVNYSKAPFFKLLPVTIKTSTGKAPSTTDMRHPDWHIDSSNPADPTTDSHVQPVNSGGFVDQPSDPISPGEAQAFSQMKAKMGFTTAEVQYYFEAYLIYKGRICYKVAWKKEQKWDPTKTPPLSPPKTSLVSAGLANSADPAQRNALALDYPGQTAVNPFPP